jgi:DNA-binding XRE family transcriptional regulator
MIDPDAVYTLKECAALTGRSYHRITNAVERGRLIAIQNDRRQYQVRGSDLIAWRDRVPTPGAYAEPVVRPAPRTGPRTVPRLPPSERLTADEIRRMRVRLGLSQKQLADRLGFTPTAVSRWETGRAAPNTRATLALKALLVESGAHDPH